jgi:hypothetical protein
MAEIARLSLPANCAIELTFRVRSDLKKELETIAAREGQSVARICEAFLLAFCRFEKNGLFLQPQATVHNLR